MKTILIFASGVLFTFMLAAGPSPTPKISKMLVETAKNTATVDQEEGLYIFYRSKPVAEYDFLGSYEVGMIWDDEPDKLFKKLVKKTKDKYPTADGIIINASMDKCDAIKFK